MSTYVIRRQQVIPASLKEVWAFFSDPRNLANITPADMKFQTTTPDLPEHIYPGQIITYKVSPIAGIPLNWVTEITYVHELSFFVDEQRSGPYKMWHHEHHFKETEQGTLMTDIVHYQLPLFLLGKIAHTIFVKRQLDNIFEFRRQKIAELWQ